MSAFLGQLAAQLALPLPAALALLACAFALLAFRRRRLGMACLAAAGVTLWAASTPAVAGRLAAALERAHPAPPLASLAPAAALLVLGGGTQPALPPRERPELAHAGDRVLHAARLYRAGLAPLVVVSGRGAGRSAAPTEAATMAELLVELGVPRDAILLEERATTTRENCVAAKALLDARGADDILLVTSALHMRRAFATCRGAGLAVRAAPTDFWIAGGGPRGWRALAPDPEALLLTQLALHERLGFAVYRMRGWITR